jgi:GntR family transcriptional regulator, galactonate operon transcriptional repressor
MPKRNIYPRRGLHGEVVHTIGLSILQGELQPGDPVTANEGFDADHSVSRTVTREAVRVLAAKGLVQARPKTGTRVRPRAEWNFLDPDVLAWRLEAGPDTELYEQINEIRLGIEPQVARLSADRATEDEIGGISDAYLAMVANVNDQAGYLAADLLFHDLILSACHNELLGHLGSILRGAFLRTFEYTTQPSTSRRRALALHRAILDAIAERDGDAAELAMRRLIADTAAAIRRSTKRRLANAMATPASAGARARSSLRTRTSSAPQTDGSTKSQSRLGSAAKGTE